MNTDTGEFVDDRLAEAWMERIALEEVVQIKGKESASLEVAEITKHTVTLRLMSRSEVATRALRNAYGEPANRHARRRSEKLLRKGE